MNKIQSWLFDLALWYVCKHSKTYRRLEEFLTPKNFSEIVDRGLNRSEVVFTWRHDPNFLADALRDSVALTEKLNHSGKLRSISGGRVLDGLEKKD